MERHNFATLFNISFIHLGLILYQSLAKHCSAFNLYVCCFDDITFELLNKLSYPNLVLFQLSDLEEAYPQLKTIKNGRSLGEYCWTCSSFVIKYCLEVLHLKSCTYLDADLYFLKSPTIILDSLPQNKNVIITRHNYSAPLEFHAKTSGLYCVQFMYFNQEETSKAILNKWATQCLEWCYNYYDEKNDRFGDQKYLDDWHNFDNVYIPANQAIAAGPWNMDRITAMKTHDDIVFYHFHDLKFSNNTLKILPIINLYPKVNKDFIAIYIEYINHLNAVSKYFGNYKIKRLKLKTFILKILLKCHINFNILKKLGIKLKNSLSL